MAVSMARMLVIFRLLRRSTIATMALTRIT